MKQDVFNKEGDFVTSVEISQIFNEVCLIYFIIDNCNMVDQHILTYSGFGLKFTPLGVDAHT